MIRRDRKVLPLTRLRQGQAKITQGMRRGRKSKHLIERSF